MSITEALDRTGVILTPLQSKELQLYKGDRDLDEWITIWNRLGIEIPDCTNLVIQ